MNKRFASIIAAVVLVSVGFWWLTKPSATETKQSSKPTNHVEGAGAKNVKLVEYGDYECPACKAYHPLVKAVVDQFKADIFFQFRNFPLEGTHLNARAGARAAEAANKQGKFWEMHDALYENQDSWKASSDPLSFYKTYAKQVGVADLNKFETDYKSKAVNDMINADLKEGQKLKVTSTPTFFIDGKKIDNPRDQAAFNKLIEDAIAAKQK